MQNRIPMTGADSPEALMRQQAPWEYGLSGAFPVDVSGYQPALPMTNILKQIAAQGMTRTKQEMAAAGPGETGGLPQVTPGRPHLSQMPDGALMMYRDSAMRGQPLPGGITLDDVNAELAARKDRNASGRASMGSAVDAMLTPQAVLDERNQASGYDYGNDALTPPARMPSPAMAAAPGYADPGETGGTPEGGITSLMLRGQGQPPTMQAQPVSMTPGMSPNDVSGPVPVAMGGGLRSLPQAKAAPPDDEGGSNDWALPLMAAGLGLMSSGNLGQAGLAGLKTYMGESKTRADRKDKAEMRGLKKREVDIAEARAAAERGYYDARSEEARAHAAYWGKGGSAYGGANPRLLDMKRMSDLAVADALAEAGLGSRAELQYYPDKAQAFNVAFRRRLAELGQMYGPEGGGQSGGGIASLRTTAGGGGSGLPEFSSAEEAAKLPSGSRFTVRGRPGKIYEVP